MGCCSSQLVDNERNQTQTSTSTNGNKQLRRKSLSWTTDTPLTLEQLQAKRDSFWEASSTYEGRKEVWQNLRTACETTDIAQAQNIVNSLKLSVPTGYLSDGCCDEQGNRYAIPLYCFVEPTNLIRPSDDHSKNREIGSIHEMSDKKATNNAGFPSQIPTITITEHVDSESEPEAEPELEPEVSYKPTAEPVYTPPTPPTSIGTQDEELIIRLNTGKDVVVKASPEDTVMVVKNKLSAIENIDPASVTIRFIYMGKILEDSMVVKDIQVPSGGVIQALVVLV